MLKALRYLKPFWLSVLAVIALTFAQVQFELALPDYMSGIVTYGIQYSGIDNPSPKALRASTYEHMKSFMDQQEQLNLDSAYTLVPAGTEAYASEYPRHCAPAVSDGHHAGKRGGFRSAAGRSRTAV